MGVGSGNRSRWVDFDKDEDGSSVRLRTCQLIRRYLGGYEQLGDLPLKHGSRVWGLGPYHIFSVP